MVHVRLVGAAVLQILQFDREQVGGLGEEERLRVGRAELRAQLQLRRVLLLGAEVGHRRLVLRLVLHGGGGSVRAAAAAALDNCALRVDLRV